MSTYRPYVPVIHGASVDRPDEADTVIAALAVHDALRRLGYRTETIHVDRGLGAIAALAERRPDAVFNLVEALDGDGTLAHLAPSFLDYFEIPYTGGSAASLRETQSKTAVKQRLRGAGLPTPSWSEDGLGVEGVGQVIVKSIGEHASLGMDSGSVVPAERAGDEIRVRQDRFGNRFFAEAYIEGREFNLSLIEKSSGPLLLPQAEIDFIDFPAGRPQIVDYEAKWQEGSFAFVNTPRRFDFPESDAPLLTELSDLALAAWDLLELNGYARVDFRVDRSGRPWILEVNVNPCLSPDAGFAAAAERAGMGFDVLIDRIVSTTLARRRKAA